MNRALLFILSFLLLFPATSRANMIDYQTANIQLLKGYDYKLGPEDRTIATFEYFNKWTLGDFFVFADGTRYDEGGTNLYTELSPRFSLSKISNREISFGPVKDVLLSSTLELGKQGEKAYLYGGAVDFDLEGFRTASINIYRRDNPDIQGATWQTTLVWKRPFWIGNVRMVAEGFADIAGREGANYKANQAIVPRLLVDIGAMTGKPGKLYGGIEWQYWHNKAGVSGANESVPQLQLKWVFF